MSVWKQHTGVVEADDAVAQEAPALLGVINHDACRVMIDGLGRGTSRSVLAHERRLRISPPPGLKRPSCDPAHSVVTMVGGLDG